MSGPLEAKPVVLDEAVKKLLSGWMVRSLEQPFYRGGAIYGHAIDTPDGAETPIGFVKVLENALNQMELVLEEEREHLARTEKRMADILVEVAKPFDKAERLTWLQQRQREIDAALDLTKGDLAAAEEAETSEAA